VQRPVDYDPHRMCLYFTTTDSSQVFRIDVGSRAMRLVAQIATRPGRVGAIALDSKEDSLYIADGGKILLLRLGDSGKQATTVYSKEGAISGLRVDDDGSLYITDVKRQIVEQLRRTSAEDPSLEHIKTLASEMSRPTGVALLAHGYLAISDSQDDIVVVVDSQGNRLYRVGLVE
jgi:sugar lactone lactonase YvrE